MDPLQDILTQHEAALREEIAQLAAAEATVARLKPKVAYRKMVVEGARGLVATEADASPTKPQDGFEPKIGDIGAVLQSAAETMREMHANANGVSKLTYGGKPSIPAVIFDVLGQDDADLDTIFLRICAHDAYGGRKKPSRGSVTNRLNEMAVRGEILRVRRGVYKSLPPAGGTGNPDVRGGPNPAIQLGREQPPGDQLIPDRPGHQSGEGSAEAASRF